MEEFKPGYFIKYDGFRSKNKYTYVTPEGTKGDFATYGEVWELAVKDKCVFGVPVDVKLPFPWEGPGNKWYSRKYNGQTVIVLVEWSDGWMLIDDGNKLEVVKDGI